MLMHFLLPLIMDLNCKKIKYQLSLTLCGEKRDPWRVFSSLPIFFSLVWLWRSPQKNQQRPERGSIIGFPCWASLNITSGEQQNMELHLIWQRGSHDCIIWLWLFLPPPTWGMVCKTCSNTNCGCSLLRILYSPQKSSGARAGCA